MSEITDAMVEARARELATEQAAVFHTALRHVGDSVHATIAHDAIDQMDGDEWISIVAYGLHWIAKRDLENAAALAARPAPADQIADAIAAEVMGLPWTRGGDDVEQCRRHGDVQEAVQKALAARPAPTVTIDDGMMRYTAPLYRPAPTVPEDVAGLVECANSWDRCYPGNVDVEQLVSDMTAALTAQAARIAELEADNGRLRGAVREIISQIDQGGEGGEGGKVFARDACIARARAAITEGGASHG